jgi:hypothetical protein
MAGTELPDEIPEAWIEEAEREARGPAPTRLSEDAPALPTRGADVIGRVIDDVRRTIFPAHGLTP